jgi:hypothetical protein
VECASICVMSACAGLCSFVRPLPPWQSTGTTPQCALCNSALLPCAACDFRGSTRRWWEAWLGLPFPLFSYRAANADTPVLVSKEDKVLAGSDDIVQFLRTQVPATPEACMHTVRLLFLGTFPTPKQLMPCRWLLTMMLFLGVGARFGFHSGAAGQGRGVCVCVDGRGAAPQCDAL